MMVYACKPSTQKAEAGKLEVQGHLGLYSEYTIPCPRDRGREKRGEEEEAREAIATEAIVDDPVTSKTKEL